MARDLRIIKRGWFPIPKQVYEPKTKVIVDGSNVSTSLISWHTVHRATVGIGQFTTTLSNLDNQFIDDFSVGNDISIYQDYNPAPGTSFTPTTLRFQGKLDRYHFLEDIKNGNRLVLAGRDWPHVMDWKYNMRFNGEGASEAIISAVAQLNSYYSSDVVTADNVESNNTAVYRNYKNKSCHQIVSDICKRIDHDCRWDTTGNLVTHGRDSVNDYNNYAIVGVNVKSAPRFGADGSQVSNRVIARSSLDGNSYYWLDEDTDDQSATWLKGGEFNDSSISTIQELTDYSTAIKGRSLLKGSIAGTVNVVGNYGFVEGTSIPVRIPKCGINNMMPIATMTHDYVVGRGFTTGLQLNETRKTTAALFKDTIKSIEGVTDVSNPNNMIYSFIMDFQGTSDADNFVSSKESGMVYSDGKLVMNATADTLVTVSTQFTLPANISQAELLVVGEQNAASTYRVRFTIDDNFQSISPGTDNAVAVENPGTTGKLEITSKSDSYNVNPKWDSIIVRCK